MQEAGVRCWWVLGDAVLRMLVLEGSRSLGRDMRRETERTERVAEAGWAGGS